MILKRMKASDLEMMKIGTSKVFAYDNYRQYECARSMCSRYGRIFNRRFSTKDNNDNTFTVICKERKSKE